MCCWHGLSCSWWERQPPPGGFWPPGFGFSKRLPGWEGLELEARAGRFVPIGNGDLTHRSTAMPDGLRDRSASEAEVMFVCQCHWNRMSRCTMQAPCQVFSKIKTRTLPAIAHWRDVGQRLPMPALTD